MCSPLHWDLCQSFHQVESISLPSWIWAQSVTWPWPVECGGGGGWYRSSEPSQGDSWNKWNLHIWKPGSLNLLENSLKYLRLLSHSSSRAPEHEFRKACVPHPQLHPHPKASLENTDIFVCMWHKGPIALDPILSKAHIASSFPGEAEQSPWVLSGHILCKPSTSCPQDSRAQRKEHLGSLNTHFAGWPLLSKFLLPVKVVLQVQSHQNRTLFCMHEWTELRGRVHTVGGSGPALLSHTRQFHPSWPMRSPLLYPVGLWLASHTTEAL